MINSSSARLIALALTLPLSAALGAQGAPAVQLAFGYECGDRFLVKNDGDQPVSLEWKAAGSQDRSQLRLGGHESREIASASSDPVELWVGGKLVATEPKGNRACGNTTASPAASEFGAQQAAGPTVVVRPLDSQAATDANQGDPPSRVARVSSMQGSVSFQAAGTNDWGAAALNASITTGDRLVSDDGGRAELEIGSLAVRLGSSTDVTVTNLTDGLLQLGVPAGTVRLSVYRMNQGDTIEVDTPNGAMSVLAPGNYRVATNSDGTQTIVSVERGRVELSGPNLSQVIDADRTVSLSLVGNSVQVGNAARPGPDGFDAWSSYRDGMLTNTASQSAAYVNPDVPGVRDLDAAGSWGTDAAYGPIWYPTAVVTGWAPYRFGHWAWVEPWGWTWIADEPWGFAPFHYGRWAFVGSRWGWVPGPRAVRPYYAPALVAFANGAGFGLSIGVTAWFPLGPRDPFLPWYHYNDRYLLAVNAANVRGVTNFRAFVNTRNVNQFRYADRSRGTTVVPTSAFSSGRQLGRDLVNVSPARIAAARIESHPNVVPTRETAIGGTVVPRPRAAVERISVVPVGPRPAMEPMRGRAQPPTPTSVTQVPRPLVARSPLPPPTLPFDVRRKAISQNPGRPLEPQQIQNLRAGRPAGPQRDQAPAQPPAKKRPAEKKDKKPS